MLTTIKVYAYYTAKIHKNKLQKFQTVSQSWIRICFVNIRELYSEAVLGTLRLIENKIKGCKSLRPFNHLPIVHPNVYQPKVHQHFSWDDVDG